MLKAYEKEESLGSFLGIEKDQERERFDRIVSVLKENNIDVIRYDERKDVKEFEKGMILPCFKLNDEIVLSGEYPKVSDVVNWFNLDEKLFSHIQDKSQLIQAANDNRIGYCCGVGTDVYVDPNEEE